MRFDDVQEGDELPTRELFLAKDQVWDYARARTSGRPASRTTRGKREGLPA
jgi:hypothetical protein